MKVGIIQCISALGCFSSLLGSVEVFPDMPNMPTSGFGHSNVSRAPVSNSKSCFDDGALAKSDGNHTETHCLVDNQSDLPYFERSQKSRAIPLLDVNLSSSAATVSTALRGTSLRDRPKVLDRVTVHSKVAKSVDSSRRSDGLYPTFGTKTSILSRTIAPTGWSMIVL